ncbi:divalent-cation tolerance protein CutA [Streptomyces millisiae]|uniref:Divalent-cation tolerance protein CutA n=1 Tax=Streptomyces millisiae TaxID=3075542 RepID=A0ABU2LZE8_9ACTN|nr:divalent-cation tolerance protein CutA [Streptomyces sp. DSM 44918]MDT0322972.1 divalent-cation tolerance protein CutA [Streptomyces sp. DSM 44918]
MTNYVQVSTATETREAAEALARSAVEARLAAGAQIVGPVVSVFWHLGEFGTGEEWRLLFKTTTDRYPELEEHLLAHHPWQNPEVVAVPVITGSAGYLDWIRGTTS